MVDINEQVIGMELENDKRKCIYRTYKVLRDLETAECYIKLVTEDYDKDKWHEDDGESWRLFCRDIAYPSLIHLESIASLALSESSPIDIDYIVMHEGAAFNSIWESEEVDHVVKYYRRNDNGVFSQFERLVKYIKDFKESTVNGVSV